MNMKQKRDVLKLYIAFKKKDSYILSQSSWVRISSYFLGYNGIKTSSSNVLLILTNKPFSRAWKGTKGYIIYKILFSASACNTLKSRYNFFFFFFSLHKYFLHAFVHICNRPTINPLLFTLPSHTRTGCVL